MPLLRAFWDRVLELRPFAELALRVVASLLLLPPAFGGRAIFAPKGQGGHLIGPNLHSGRAERALIVLANRAG